MKIKFKKKTILAILMICIIRIFSVSVFGEITPGEMASDDIKLFSEVLFGITKVLSFIGGILLAPLMMLAVAIAAIITLIFGTMCSLLLGTISGGEDKAMFIPFADQIIFNKLAAFDPNFINPAKSSGDKWSLIELMSKIVSPLYFTGQTLVGGIFIILALIIGIKLAISATAQEKAQYKSAISKWVMGIFFLLVGHIYMSAIFTINESIVATVSKSADKVVIPVALVSLEDLDAVWGAVKQIGVNIINLFLKKENELGSQLHYRIVVGYSGLFYYHMLNSIANQDFASLLIWYILIGQTVAIMIVYFKRVFLAIFLGIMYPFTVAMDTFQKITGKNQNLLGNWIKNFTINVFSQTFHAFIIYFSLIVMSQVIQVAGQPQKEGLHIINPEVLPAGSKLILMDDQDESIASASIVSILQIVAIMSVVSLEKLIKEFTGVSTGKLGNVSQNGMQIVSATGATMRGVRNLADNASGLREAKKRRDQARMTRYQTYNELTKGKDRRNDISDIKRGLFNGNNSVIKMMNKENDTNNNYNEMLKRINASRIDKNKSGNIPLQARGYVDSNGAVDEVAAGIVDEMGEKNPIFASSYGGAPVGYSNNPSLVQSVSTRLNKTSDALDEIRNIRGGASAASTIPTASRNIGTGMSEEPKVKLSTSQLNGNLETKEEAQLREKYIKSFEDEKKATIDLKKKAIATALTPGITIASIGVGMGTANSVDDVFRVSGMMASALDGAVEKGSENVLKKISKTPFEVKLKDSNLQARTADHSSLQSAPSGGQTIINNTNTVNNNIPSASRTYANNTINTKEVVHEKVVEKHSTPRQFTDKHKE